MIRYIIPAAGFIALALLNSPALADQLQGAVQASDTPLRLPRTGSAEPAETAPDVAPLKNEGVSLSSFQAPAKVKPEVEINRDKSPNLLANAKLLAVLNTGAKRQCGCSSKPLQHFTNHLAPRFTGTLTESPGGRVIGMPVDEKGKYVFAEFNDTARLLDPAWSTWLLRLRDCLQQQWIAHKTRDCEFMLKISVTQNGQIRLLMNGDSGFYPTMPGEQLAEPVLVENGNRWFREHLDVFNDFLSMEGDRILKFPRTENKDVAVYLWYQNKTYPSY